MTEYANSWPAALTRDDIEDARMALKVYFPNKGTDRAVFNTICDMAVKSLKQCDGPNREGWQPIETAPKDRNIILTDGERVSEGGWLTDVEQGADYEGQLHMAGWWSYSLKYSQPTQWQPMPECPSSATDC